MSLEHTRARAFKILQQKENRIGSLLQKRTHSAQEKIFITEERTCIDVFKELIDQYEKQAQGSVQPEALDMEEAILGALMLEKTAILYVENYLTPEHFAFDPHRLIYQAILDLRKANEPVDMRTVVNQLRVTDNILATGGAYYIAELTSKVSSAANIEYHARVVMEFAMKRSLIQLAMNVLHDAYDDTVDVFELLDAAEINLVRVVHAGGELAAQRWRKSKTEIENK